MSGVVACTALASVYWSVRSATRGNPAQLLRED
jgi:hypothetical protein